jgi:4-amino-4-deoxy-L-arabinose transferase-like glycosyltransferase
MGRRAAGASLLVVLLCAPLFLAGLGRSGLNDPDEGRNAEVAREMLVSGDWVTPHINDARYLDKPPVFFWAVASCYRLLGVHETAARLPSALSAIAALGLTVWFGRRRLGERAGLLAGVLLALSPLYLVFARLVIFDMLLLLCTTATTIAFYETMEGEGRGRLASAAGFLSAGIGTLVKGPVALLGPLLVVAAWALWRRRPGLLLRLRWGQGLLLYLAVVSPWLYLVESRNPGFLRYAVLGENLARMAANPYDTQRPFLFYAKVMAPGAFPWIVFCVAQGVRALWRRVRRGRAATAGGEAETRGAPAGSGDAAAASSAALTARFVALWLVVLLLFFSFIASKRPSYVLPCAVPVALLAARLIDRACLRRRHDAALADGAAAASAGPAAGVGPSASAASADEARGDLAWGCAFAGLISVLGAAAALVMGPALRSTLLAGAKQAPLSVRPDLFQLTAGGLLAAAVLLVLAPRARRAWVVVAASALPLVAMTPLARTAGLQIETTRSSRPLSRFLEPRLGPGDKVICFEEYRPGLNFYLQRPIYQVTRAGRIFTSNYIEKHLEEFRGDPRFRLLTKDRLQDALIDPASTAYVLADRKEYGPLFEAAGVPLRPVWEQGEFGLFVRAVDAAPTQPAGAADPIAAAPAGG